MRNIARINNYYNRIEAWNDWNRLARLVTLLGMSELVTKHRPACEASWRRIDKCKANLRNAVKVAISKRQLQRHVLVFDEGGVYVPTTVGRSVNWHRDTTGDPAWGVQVNSVAHAATFATVVRQAALEFEGSL